MVVTNHARGRIALLIANSGASTLIADSVPTQFMIGNGSGTATESDVTLVNATDRQNVTATDASVVNKITWTGDWNSVELSGLSLKEFGMMPSGAALTGSIWSRTSLPAIVFDGTNELRIEETWEVF